MILFTILDYVQVYKKKPNGGTIREMKGFGAGDVRAGKRVASGSQTSTDHIPSTSTDEFSEYTSHNSEEKLELSPSPPKMRLRRSALHRL